MRYFQCDNPTVTHGDRESTFKTYSVLLGGVVALDGDPASWLDRNRATEITEAEANAAYGTAFDAGKAIELAGLEADIVRVTGSVAKKVAVVVPVKRAAAVVPAEKRAVE